MIRDIGRGLARALTLFALLLFAAIAPLLPTSDQKVRVTMAAAVVLLGATYLRVRTKEPLGRSSLDLPALVFLCIAGLATIVSVDPLISFLPSKGRGEGLVVYIAYVVMALAAARLGRREINGVVSAVLISGSLIGGIAIAQYYGLDVIRMLGYRPGSLAEFVGLAVNPQAGAEAPPFFRTRSYGTLGNPVFLGGYVSLLLPVAVALALQRSDRRWWAYAAASALLYGALVASQTRAAWVASAGAGLLLVGGVVRSGTGWRRLAGLAAIFAAMTVIMALTRPEAPLSQRAVATVDIRDESLRQRLYLWKHTLPLIAERPLLGWGFSTLLGRFPDLGSPEYVRVFGPTLVLIDTTHNEVLHVAFSTGLIGLAAYLWVWAAAAALCGLSLRAPSGGSAPTSRLNGALLASLAAYFVWLQLAWSHVGPANIFWIFAGVAAALGRQTVTTGARLDPADQHVTIRAPSGAGAKGVPVSFRGRAPGPDGARIV